MYKFMMGFLTILRAIINGKTKLLGEDNLPSKDTNYIMIAPHRVLWDPIWHALTARPKQFIFMAKKELNVPIFGSFLKSIGAFFVDRENPGPSVIKYPVGVLRKENKSLIIYPTGSRHSNELKAGAILIARMSGVPLVPIVYQGPLKFFGLLRRDNTTVAIGPVIQVPAKRLTEKEEEKINQQIQKAFDDLDRQINPDWVYVDQHPEKAKKK